MKTLRISESSDIYSLAMTIYTLGTGSQPFEDISNERAACHAAGKGKRPSKHDLIGGLMKDEAELLWSLIERMWDQQPRLRPTISIARHEVSKCWLTRNLGLLRVVEENNTGPNGQASHSLNNSSNSDASTLAPHSGSQPFKTSLSWGERRLGKSEASDI